MPLESDKESAMFSRRDFLNTSLWAGAGLALGVHRAALAADGKGALFQRRERLVQFKVVEAVVVSR